MKPRFPKTGGAVVSLFPFLAVLLCTMGALIVVLIVIAQQARTQARSLAASRAIEHDDDDLRKADLEWRNGLLKESVAKTAEQLSEKRLELSHVEDHTRRLSAQLAEVQAAQESLDRMTKGETRQFSQNQRTLADLEERLAGIQQEIADARGQAAARPNTYAIVPYHGANSTNRRPLYIECKSDAVVFQPEGISLREEDFAGSLGPSNPLAAGLRAAREQWASSQPAGEDGDPYPLLLVRPDGVLAYYAARAALASWGGDFGYELIEGDWALELPRANQETAEAVRLAVEEARFRQDLLAKSAPRKALMRERPSFRPTGGWNRGPGTVDRGPGRQDRGPGTQDRGPWTGDRGPGFSHGDEGFGEGGMTAGNSRRSMGALNRDGSGAESMRDRLPSNPFESALGPGDGGAFGDRLGPKQQNKPQNLVGNAQRRPGESGQSGRTRPEFSTTSAKDGSRGQANNPGGSPGMPSNQSSADGSAGQKPGSEAQLSPVTAEATSSVESLAKTRGENWGLPNAAAGSVAITRPIRLVCDADHLSIPPDGNNRSGAKVIELSSHTEDSVQELVSAVWERIDSWGIAGRGMYWRPTLSIDVRPGGEQRFADLEALLGGSGLDVRSRRKNPSVAQYPRTSTPY